MPRSPKIVHKPDGAASIRLNIPASIMMVMERVANDLEMPIESSFRMLLTEVAERFEEGDALFLSKQFQRALRQVREENFNVLSNGPHGAPGIDLTKLHRSNKVKSGFAGVYANGKGFRAVAKDKGIGTYPTAEEAAWRRYLYYKQNRLPYGEFEEEVAEWRSPKHAGISGFKGSDEELVRAIWDLHQHTGLRDRIFGLRLENVPEHLHHVITGKPRPAEEAKADPLQFNLHPRDARLRAQTSLPANTSQPPIEPAGGVPMSVFDDQEDS